MRFVTRDSLVECENKRSTQKSVKKKFKDEAEIKVAPETRRNGVSGYKMGEDNSVAPVRTGDRKRNPT